MTGAAPEDLRFVSFDRTPIHYILQEADEKPQATLVVIHGAGEHAARYKPLAAYFAARRIRSALLDLRGYGQSGGARAFVRSFDDYSGDILALARKLKSDGTGPLFVLAHSMGALVAVHALALYSDEMARGLILSSPCFGLAFRIPPFIELVAKAQSVLSPHYLHPTRVLSEILTHDARLVEDHRHDPMILHKMSSRLFALMSDAMKRAPAYARSIRCPALVLQAGDDRVVNTTASRAFFEALPGPDKTFKLYEGLFHEILNETSREAIYNDILRWIQGRCK